MATKKTVRVQATLGEGFTIESKMGNHVVYVDQPKEQGGADTGPTPLQYLFLAVAGCIGSVARIIANQKRLPLRSMEITVEGDVDLERLLGKNLTSRAGFESVRLSVKMDADMNAQEKKHFLEEVESRCPVSENLANMTPVSIQLAE